MKTTVNIKRSLPGTADRALLSNLVGGWNNKTYDVSLFDYRDTGNQHEFGGLVWVNDSTSVLVKNVFDSAGDVGGFTFPFVDILPGQAIIKAELTYTVTGVTVPTDLKFRIGTPQAVSTRFSSGAGNGPFSLVAIGGELVGQPGTEGTHTIDITDQVQAAINHANWKSGDFLRIAIIYTTSPDGEVVLGGVSSSSSNSPPRLLITHGIEGVKFPDPASFLYYGNVNGNDPLFGSPTHFDNAAISCWVRLDSKWADGVPRQILSANNILKNLTSALTVKAGADFIGGMGLDGEQFGVAPDFAVRGPTSSPDDIPIAIADGWAHYLIKIERLNATPNNRYRAYKNGVLIESTDWYDNAVQIFQLISLCISGHGDTVAIRQASGLDSAFTDGSIAALWFHCANDAAALPDPEDFIDSLTLAPKDLGADGSKPTGTQPLLYIDGDAAVWSAGTNRGTAGDFTRYGNALTDSN